MAYIDPITEEWVLTPREEVHRTLMLHPDFTAQMVRDYLQFDAFVPDADLPTVEQIEQWTAEATHRR